MGKKELKTNAMRMLERQKIPFTCITYECDGFIDGIQIADQLKEPHELVYKTLVTVGKSKEHYVFVIPIEEELDLKKAARAVAEKSLLMLPLKDLTAVTGYVRGGCTAIGMKKAFPVVVEKHAEALEEMIVSGGKIGMQIRISPENFQKATGAVFEEIIVSG
nr:Cys-tRNA(Pro) deacylase [uncultured Faecalimonas sp.]